MERKTLTTSSLYTISWFGNTIVDWGAAGTHYFMDGQVKQLHKYHLTLNFDGSINSVDGKYAFIYQKLGTKGLLLKEGELLREINRSYYCANVYEYPAAFVTVNNITYLIHCPISYCQLDFENVETGEIVTNIPQRNAGDEFYSRLEISSDSKFLMSKGWHWHPVDVVYVFDINECLRNPLMLDHSVLSPDADTEICTASFIDNTRVLVGTSGEVFNDEADISLNNFPPKHIAIWYLETNLISKPVKVNGEFGNLFAIDEDQAWDMYLFPKIINIHTGEIIDKDETLDSGKQNSAITGQNEQLPQIVFNRQTKQIAISGHGKIEILTP
ncbi:hypothetical protein SAMN05428975_2734 [Mucilaginibacter sp. OK268]|uniref:hypothetical protein n=1 Tax=Mucilaginibacter sp. OK268 TaxID=1881048 RepID=UPI0008907445|nr:hypothetical protein [Mucilaginibacter sp. OK268]SDP78376.1 hypothetical protein SAMN05428975_2734 [Mucilaginibacter sp. OK268]